MDGCDELRGLFAGQNLKKSTRRGDSTHARARVHSCHPHGCLSRRRRRRRRRRWYRNQQFMGIYPHRRRRRRRRWYRNQQCMGIYTRRRRRRRRRRVISRLVSSASHRHHRDWTPYSNNHRVYVYVYLRYAALNFEKLRETNTRSKYSMDEWTNEGTNRMDQLTKWTGPLPGGCSSSGVLAGIRREVWRLAWWAQAEPHMVYSHHHIYWLLAS